MGAQNYAVKTNLEKITPILAPYNNNFNTNLKRNQILISLCNLNIIF